MPSPVILGRLGIGDLLKKTNFFLNPSSLNLSYKKGENTNNLEIKCLHFFHSKVFKKIFFFTTSRINGSPRYKIKFFLNKQGTISSHFGLVEIINSYLGFNKIIKKLFINLKMSK